jgi:hypothetical protein
MIARLPPAGPAGSGHDTGAAVTCAFTAMARIWRAVPGRPRSCRHGLAGLALAGCQCPCGQPLVPTGLPGPVWFFSNHMVLAGAPLRNRTVDLLLTIRIRSRRQPGISPERQVRRSTSARLGQVRDSSRRMRPPKFLPTVDGGGAHVPSRFHPAQPMFDTRCYGTGRACRSSPRHAQFRWLSTGR